MRIGSSVPLAARMQCECLSRHHDDDGPSSCLSEQVEGVHPQYGKFPTDFGKQKAHPTMVKMGDDASPNSGVATHHRLTYH